MKKSLTTVSDNTSATLHSVAQKTVVSKKKKSAYKKNQTGFILSFIIYPLILFVIFYVYVNINSFVMAFTTSDLSGKVTFAGFDNFKTFIDGLKEAGNVISISLVNSLKMYLINLVICMPLYIIFSYMLYKKCFMHKSIRALVMVPQIISGFIISLLFVNFISGGDSPAMSLFEKLGIFVDENGRAHDLLYTEKYAFGTTIFYGIWLSFGTNLIVYPNAMKEIDNGIVESSRLDGVSNMFQDLRYIILPLIFPTLETFFITGFAAIFTNSGPLVEFYNTSAPMYVYNMGYYYSRMVLAGQEVEYPVLAAGGLLMTLIVAPLTLLLRHLLEKYGPTTEA